MDRLVLKKRFASVLSQRKTTIREEKIESSANDFAENCMKYYLAVDIGASSGRLILGHLENGKMVLEQWRAQEKGA